MLYRCCARATPRSGLHALRKLIQKSPPLWCLPSPSYLHLKHAHGTCLSPSTHSNPSLIAVFMKHVATSEHCSYIPNGPILPAIGTVLFLAFCKLLSIRKNDSSPNVWPSPIAYGESKEVEGAAVVREPENCRYETLSDPMGHLDAS